MQAVGPLVADVHYCGKPDVLLETQTGVPRLRDRRVAGPLSNVLRAERSLQRLQVVDAAVVGGRLVSYRRLAGHAVHLVAVEAIVEGAETAAQRSLAIAEHIQCE